jgi:putative endonuclease
MSGQWYVYILECAGFRLYVGITQDLDGRFADHQEGKGAQYTVAYQPERVVWFEKHPDASSARKREIQLKGWTRRKKDALIRGDLKALKTL